MNSILHDLHLTLHEHMKTSDPYYKIPTFVREGVLVGWLTSSSAGFSLVGDVPNRGACT